MSQVTDLIRDVSSVFFPCVLRITVLILGHKSHTSPNMGVNRKTKAESLLFNLTDIVSFKDQHAAVLSQNSENCATFPKSIHKKQAYRIFLENVKHYQTH